MVLENAGDLHYAFLRIAVMKRSLFAFGMVMVALTARSGQYFQDFTTENVGSISYSDGSTINGIEFGGTSSIGVRDSTYKELQLTANGTSETHASWMLPDLDPGSAVYAFSARWNLEMNRSLTNAADGFSFNFGQLADLEVGNVGYAQEAGYPTGICFSVQTYQSNSPGFYLRANGSTLAALAYDPLIRWGLTNSARHYFEVDWHFQAGMTVRMDGQTIFSNVVMTGFAPLAGDRFVWAARAAASPGSASQEVRLDNVVVVTAGNLVQLPLTSPYYKSGEYTNANQTADKAFDGIVATKWLTFECWLCGCHHRFRSSESSRLFADVSRRHSRPRPEPVDVGRQHEWRNVLDGVRPGRRIFHQSQRTLQLAGHQCQYF